MWILPEVVVEEDYDGYFESFVKGLIARKAERRTQEFKHFKIVITAGPWRPYAVMWEEKDDGLYLDFYSALRRGFGSLSSEEVDELTKLL